MKGTSKTGMRYRRDEVRGIAELVDSVNVEMMSELEAKATKEIEARVGRPLYDESGEMNLSVLNEFRDNYTIDIVRDFTSMSMDVCVRRIS